jgi:hypothetical protein
MPRGPVQPLQLALGLWLERSGADLAVDKPTEFYHSRCWASSNLSTSGEFARSTQGELIMVGDIVSSRLRKASPEVEFSSYSGRHSQVP